MKLQTKLFLILLSIIGLFLLGTLLMLFFQFRELSYLKILTPIDELRHYRIISSFIVFYALFAVVFLTVFAWLIEIWVTGPLKKISDSLDSGDLNHVEELLGSKSEFGLIARLFESSMLHKREIAEEVSRRQEAEEKLLKALETNSRFIAMVSHEIKNPLYAINESANILVDGSVAGSVNEGQRHFLGIVKRNTERLIRMTDNLLSLKKSQLVMVPSEIKENDINDVVRDVCESLEFFAREKRLTLATELCEWLPLIRFYRDGIVQVLVNLVNNAIKVTEKGCVTVVTVRDDGGIHVMVSDTGPGIKKEDMPRLFRSFEQIEGSKAKGTGLGLFISKEIIETHKGKIWAESEYGKGSVFHFILPVSPA